MLSIANRREGFAAFVLLASLVLVGGGLVHRTSAARADSSGAAGSPGWRAPDPAGRFPDGSVPTGAIVANGLRPPVAGGIVSSGFGGRWGRAHEGIDVAADTGALVRAALGGIVVEAGEYLGYGLHVVIDHGAGGSTVYAHLSGLGVEVGLPVYQGDVIGLVGCTGLCTGPHLHFEVRVHGIAQDPLPYIP